MLKERLSHLELLGCGLVLLAIILTIDFENYTTSETEISDSTELDNKTHGLFDENSFLLDSSHSQCHLNSNYSANFCPTLSNQEMVNLNSISDCSRNFSSTKNNK